MPTRSKPARSRSTRKAPGGAKPPATSSSRVKRGGTSKRTKKQKTVGGEEFRFVTAKLYGDDAEMADWVADHANLTDIVTSAVRLCHATLQKFFNQTLPDHFATPKVRLRHIDQTHPLMMDVQTDVYQQYIEADRAIEEKFGKSPGPEFLMALAIQRETPSEIADEYMSALVERFGKPARE